MFIIFAILISAIRCDLLKTVYCSQHCNDYLQLPEASIPKCSEPHLKHNQCGTVISCSWADIKLEKERKSANSTDNVVCCYKVQLKEKGDCDAQFAKITSTTPKIDQNLICKLNDEIFVLIGFLLFIICVLSIYIVYSCVFRHEINAKIADHHDTTALTGAC
ncbi:unnamed protein product [Caenorhabditis bovis]|uniref:Uncharacterized protein n=1 Tax=Caenorhabditis bovis TaxID=2654633 RepID=A0A8S1FE69_9PELO|nr:unnamed protein product [Caenorhabditis bovis]